jgi:hypothetical protein
VGLIAADQYVGFLFVVDMHVVAWLEDFICDNCDHCVVVLVSHDRYRWLTETGMYHFFELVFVRYIQFLDSVTTDIVELKDKGLQYFSGNYSDWVLHEEEVAARNENRLDAQTRREDHVKKSIEMARARGHDNVAKSKVKKLERASMNKRLDGKKFHTRSLQKLVSYGLNPILGSCLIAFVVFSLRTGFDSPRKWKPSEPIVN